MLFIDKNISKERRAKKMKKKCLAALTVAMMLAAMPVVSYAAGSSSYSHGSSSSSNSSSSSTSKSEAGTASGATVTVTTPTVQVTESGAKVTVATATKDATGTTVGLVGSSGELPCQPARYHRDGSQHICQLPVIRAADIRVR